MYYKILDWWERKNSRDIGTDIDRMLRDLARQNWAANMDLPTLGVYMTDYGSMEIVPLTDEEIRRVYKRRNKRLKKGK